MLTAVMGLVAGDVALVQQSHADLVEAMKQTVAAEGLHLEFLGEAEVVRDGLILEINRQVIGKVSANEGARITRKPNSPSAHAACSREEPQPKFLPVTRMVASRKCSWLSTKSSRPWPSE